MKKYLSSFWGRALVAIAVSWLGFSAWAAAYPITGEFEVSLVSLKAGNGLNTPGAINFVAGCTIKVTDLATMTFAKGDTFVVATASSVEGLPVLDASQQSIFEVINTGKTLVLKALADYPLKPAAALATPLMTTSGAGSAKEGTTVIYR